MDKTNIKICMSNTDNPKHAIPILGKAYPTVRKGYYGVKAPALIKTLYAVACPQCDKIMIVNSDTEGVKEFLCEKCHAVIILRAVTPKEAAKSDTTSSKEKEDKKKGEKPDDRKRNSEVPPQEPDKNKNEAPDDSRKPTERYKLNKGKESNAKLVWWSITGRKKYILKEGKNYV